jgi:hypothetical protein
MTAYDPPSATRETPDDAHSRSFVICRATIRPIMFARCSLLMNPPLRPFVRLMKRVVNYLPWSSCGGTFPGSRTTRMPGCACARLPAGSLCRRCPRRSHGPIEPDHRRGDGPLHPGGCGANTSAGGLGDRVGSDRLSRSSGGASGDRPAHTLRRLIRDLAGSARLQAFKVAVNP